jgi:hypothetical protein
MTNQYREDARVVAKESYWTIWKFLPVIGLLLLIGFGLRGLGLVGSKVVERQVMVNSHQYKEGMAQRAGVLKANIEEVNAMILAGEGDRQKLASQKRVLRAQLRAITVSDGRMGE